MPLNCDDDGKLGRMRAESVYAILIEGEPISAVPLKMDLKPRIYSNSKAVRMLKFNIPDDLPSKATVI